MVLNTVRRLLYGLVIALPITLFITILTVFDLLLAAFIIICVVAVLYLLGLAVEDEIRWNRERD